MHVVLGQRLPCDFEDSGAPNSSRILVVPGSLAQGVGLQTLIQPLTVLSVSDPIYF